MGASDGAVAALADPFAGRGEVSLERERSSRADGEAEAVAAAPRKPDTDVLVGVESVRERLTSGGV